MRVNFCVNMVGCDHMCMSVCVRARHSVCLRPRSRDASSEEKKLFSFIVKKNHPPHTLSEFKWLNATRQLSLSLSPLPAVNDKHGRPMELNELVISGGRGVLRLYGEIRLHGK